MTRPARTQLFTILSVFLVAFPFLLLIPAPNL